MDRSTIVALKDAPQHFARAIYMNLYAVHEEHAGRDQVMMPRGPGGPCGRLPECPAHAAWKDLSDWQQKVCERRSPLCLHAT